jgi:anti-anti-sigma factor
MESVEPTVSSSLLGDGNALVVTVTGELGLATVDRVRAAAEPAISERLPLVLDLERCEFIDSMGVDLTLRLHSALSEDADGAARMAVVSDHPQVRRIFELAGIEGLIPIFRSREEAMEWARAQPDRRSGDSDA